MLQNLMKHKRLLRQNDISLQGVFFVLLPTIVLENDAKCWSLQYIIKISLLVHVCLEVGQTKKTTEKLVATMNLQYTYSCSAFK